MSDILNLLTAQMAMGDNYDQRKVAYNKLKNGLAVDTAYTTDMGYETAIQDVSGSWYPVERYSDKKASEKGHKKWVKFAKNGVGKTITKLGYGGLVDSKKVTLK